MDISESIRHKFVKEAAAEILETSRKIHVNTVLHKNQYMHDLDVEICRELKELKKTISYTPEKEKSIPKNNKLPLTATAKKERKNTINKLSTLNR
jgi:hypothetical protein